MPRVKLAFLVAPLQTTDILRPATTIRRAVAALAACVAVIALALSITTAGGWLANPTLGPHGVLETIFAFAVVFGLWALGISIVIALFAGVPWAILHCVGLRSWWIAPLAGFVVAFCLAFGTTTANGLSNPNLRSSAWVDGKATMLEGRLTLYGTSLYGPMAATRHGFVFGTFGAVVATILWRIAYRRVTKPSDVPVSAEPPV